MRKIRLEVLMQIVQTLNDFIKILYSPSLENLCLGDFLLIQEASQRFLGQVVEIEDDKFDDSKNLAKIKLTHSIKEDGTIIDFNNSLPSKQCEILYANWREIVDFVNENKKIIKFGEDFKFSKPFELNVDFFNNNPLIFCDTIKEHNHFSSHLAKKLSSFRKVILFDYTGALEIEGAQRFSAKIDFKLPLDYHSLDYIWKKGLSNATLETQAICEEIFNEVRNYSKIAKDKFIPYNKFVKVIQKQYKATPIQELLVLKNRLKNYQQEELFANAKSEFLKIFEEIGKEKISIIDLSNLKTFWHKDFTEFILRNIKISSYVFTRLNESNFDYDTLHLFYHRDRKYSVIPSISHVFPKLPAISEYCQNYVILPTIALKKDFGHINNTICTMASDTVMFFGKDVKNFAFLVKNIGKEKDEKKTTGVKKQAAKVTFEGDVIKNIRAKDKLTQLSQKKIKEIEQEVDQFISSGAKFEKPEASVQEEVLIRPAVSAEEEIEIQPQEEIEIISQEETPVETAYSEPQTQPQIQVGVGFQIEEIISEEELDLIDAAQFNKDAITPEEEAFESIVESGFESKTTAEIVEEIHAEMPIEYEENKALEEIISTEEITLTPEEFLLNKEAVLSPETAQPEETPASEAILPAESTVQPVTTADEETQEISFTQVGEEIEEILEEIEDGVKEEADKEFKDDEESPLEKIEKTYAEDELEQGLLNEFEPTDEKTTEETETLQDIKPLTHEQLEEIAEELSLEDLATASIETAFDEVVDVAFESKKSKETETLSTVGENAEAKEVQLQQEKSKSSEYIEEIPIYTPEVEIKSEEELKYTENDSVFHDKYGEGKVLQVIEYADKILLQIEFEQIGKRLLDPAVAGLKKIKG